MNHKLSALAIAVLTAACSDMGNPVSPALSPSVQVVNFAGAGQGRSFVVHAVNWPGNASEFATVGIIGPAGGTLSIPAADFTITFPAGALSQNVAITIIKIAGSAVAYDMLPHGLQFGTPVIVTQGIPTTAAGRHAGGLLFYGAYLAPGNEAIGGGGLANAAEIEFSTTTYDSNGNAVTSTWYLNHFSKYILASGDEGSATTTTDSPPAL